MAWLSQFKLGRPGYEYSFDFNPAAMTFDEQPVAVLNRNLAGDLKKAFLKTSAPVLKINSNYLTKAQRDQFASLLSVTDTFLSFQTRDDWQVLLERNIPTTTTSVAIQNNSATRLSAALVAAGFSGQITINGVYRVADGSGTNYYSGGSSYADATRILTLASALPDTSPVFVSYTYKGWLVDIKSIPAQMQGGWIDKFTYDFELVGA